MSTALHKARRNLRALLILGFLFTIFGTVSSGGLLYLYFTRQPGAKMPAWQLWQLMLFHDGLFLMIFIGIFFATRRLLKAPTEVSETSSAPLP